MIVGLVVVRCMLRPTKMAASCLNKMDVNVNKMNVVCSLNAYYK